MAQPTVCCVMLVNGREAMVRRAIASFRTQTYPHKRLLIWDSTPELVCCDQTEYDGVVHVPAEPLSTIGALRNAVNGFWTEYPIILHWDSDDWSHPRRIEEQVALLQQSGKESVGYREMLFWDSTPGQFPAAWLYQNPIERYCVGTSLCYWREVWERHPFEDLPKQKGATGEDTVWLRGVDSLGVSSIASQSVNRDVAWQTQIEAKEQPRMIASIHGGNSQYYGSDLLAHSPSWKRVPEWDAHCREVMAL